MAALFKFKFEDYLWRELKSTGVIGSIHTTKRNLMVKVLVATFSQ